MRNRSVIYNIIDSFMRHDNPSEPVRGFFRSWLIDDEHKDEKSMALEDQWSRMNDVLDAIDGPGDGRVQYEMLEHMEKTGKRRGFYMRWHVAASLLVVFAGLAAYSAWSSRNAAGTDRMCYVTGQGSKGEFFLPDGSHVWMNANSRLEFSGDFGMGDERRVSVDGEAFFDVVKDRRPFIVSLGDEVNVKVHGTRFNVRNSEIFESVQVALQSGSVEIVNGGSQRTMLAPGCCYTFNPSRGTYSISHVNTANFSNWTKPAVVFRDETLGDVLTTLEHWYNTKITVEKGVDITLSLSFTLKNEPMDDTFLLLQTLTRYRCTVVDGSHVVISR
ncbi:MAG: FecR domain-containing protein [Bacteroidales bacterium]|nr:FecR domain-containing protein [Bacteroidales bacterium]